MTNSKKTKRYQFWINLILIVMTLTIILPFLLVFISSITDETVLIRNGYSFFPEKISFYAYQYIIRQGEKIGEIVDVINGTVKQEIFAHKSGLIFTLREYPLVYEGALLARILTGIEEKK